MSQKLFISTVTAQSSGFCLQCTWEFGAGRRFHVSVNLVFRLKSSWCNHCWEWINTNLLCYLPWADTFRWRVCCRLLSFFPPISFEGTCLRWPWHSNSLCRTEGQLHIQPQFQEIGSELLSAGLSSGVFKYYGKSKERSLTFEVFSKQRCFNQLSKDSGKGGKLQIQNRNRSS